MKMGDFTEKFNQKAHTVRYYINEGLLIPERKNNQYYFDEGCEEDMSLILELRQCQLSIQEIHKLLSVKRMSNFNDENSIRYCIEKLNQKRQQLNEQKKQLSLSVSMLDELVRKLSQYKPQKLNDLGVPIEFLKYLACPRCNSRLSLKNADLSGPHINNGYISCDCGYEAFIENGILYTNPVEDPSALWYTPESMLEYYSKEYINLLEQSYSWMFSKIDEMKTDNKVVLIVTETSGEFLFENINRLNKNWLYIVYNTSLDAARLTKERLNKTQHDLKIVYVSGVNYDFPVQKGCIDLYIDDGSIFYCLFDENCFLTNKLSSVFKNNAHIIGLYFYYKDMTKTISNLKELLPHAETSKMKLSFLKDSLASQNFMITDSNTSSTKNPGPPFIYHDTQDDMYFYTYCARKK